MSTVWTNEEEDECRKLIGILDVKLKEKNAQVSELHTSLYRNYLTIRNLTILTFLMTGISYIFGVQYRTILIIQTIDVLILILLFGNFEVSGKNGKWLKALKSRGALHELREMVRADLETGSERQVGTWRDYNGRIRSSVL